MNASSAIFKKYDIRGLFPKEISRETAYKIGFFFAGFLGEGNRAAVGRDDQPCSSELKKAVIQGLVDGGVNVIDIGLSSTPMLCFTVAKLCLKGGIELTASHIADAEHGGMKLAREGGAPLKEKELALIKEKVQKGELNLPKSKGQVENRDIVPLYVDELKRKMGSLPRAKVVMDAGNGTAGLTLGQIFRETNVDVYPLFWETGKGQSCRGSNPKLSRNREPIKKEMLKRGAELGFMWDEDGDRFYVLDSKGEVIDPSFVSFLIGQRLIRDSQEKKVVIDDRTSRIVEDKLGKMGGEVIRSKAWHTEIKKKMRETGAVFGSETSGHYIFKDFYYIDDGILASIYFLQAIAGLGQPLEELLAKLKSEYFISPEINFEIESRGEVSRILGNLEGYYKEKRGEISRLDGLSVNFPDWRFNIRPSETEPLLRLNLEANSRQLLDEKKQEIEKLIK